VPSSPAPVWRKPLHKTVNSINYPEEASSDVTCAPGGLGLNVSIRLPGLEVATVGGGTTLPYARSWLSLMGCAGPGKVYRLAQIVAAATLALEISASAAMATAGSKEFFKAHHERGGLL